MNKAIEKTAFLLKTFFGKIGKSIDGVKCKCLLGNLSPSGSGSLKFTLCD